MAQDKANEDNPKAQEDNLDLQSLDLDLEDDKEASQTKDNQDSIAKAISSARNELFGSAKGRGRVAEGVRSKKAWQPIIPTKMTA